AIIAAVLKLREKAGTGEFLRAVRRVLADGEDVADKSFIVLASAEVGETPRRSTVVIAGLDPAIHSVAVGIGTTRHGMHARIKSGHDDTWNGVERASHRNTLVRRRAKLLGIAEHEIDLRHCGKHFLVDLRRA